MSGWYGLPKRQGVLRARMEMMFAGYSIVPVKQGRISLADRNDPSGPLGKKRQVLWQRHTDEDDKFNVQEDGDFDEDFEDEDDDFDDDLDEEGEDFGDDFDEDEDDDDLDEDF